METSTPEHPQSNGMCERMMGNLVKITHAAIAEDKEPTKSLQSFLREYRPTPHGSTGKSPNQLMFGRDLRSSVPDIKDFRPVKVPGDQEVRHRDQEQKALHKSYSDKRRRARTVLINVGDSVAVKQDKTTTQPPWDPRLWTVKKVKGTQLQLERDGKSRIRSLDM